MFWNSCNGFSISSNLSLSFFHLALAEIYSCKIINYYCVVCVNESAFPLYIYNINILSFVFLLYIVAVSCSVLLELCCAGFVFFLLSILSTIIFTQLTKTITKNNNNCGSNTTTTIKQNNIFI